MDDENKFQTPLKLTSAKHNRSAWSLLTVGCPASLRCWLAYSLCLLWQTGWRWCQCFPWGCFFLRSNSSMWASSRKTVSWRHLYLPWLSATLHDDRICLFFHKVCSLGCLLGSIGRDLLVKVGRHRQISGWTSASVAHTARCLPMALTVQRLSTLYMTLLCPFGLLLSFWTLLPYLLFLVESWPYVLVALQSSIRSACCSLDPFCHRRAFQRCPCASILSLLVQQLGSLTTFCRFLSLFRLDVSVGLWSPWVLLPVLSLKPWTLPVQRIVEVATLLSSSRVQC